MVRFVDFVQPDSVLGAIVGSCAPRPRVEIARKLWSHIRGMGLRDPACMVVTDDTLLPLCDGRWRVSIFEVSFWLNRHIHDPGHS